jgi:hypothetical protein
MKITDNILMTSDICELSGNKNHHGNVYSIYIATTAPANANINPTHPIPNDTRPEPDLLFEPGSPLEVALAVVAAPVSPAPVSAAVLLMVGVLEPVLAKIVLEVRLPLVPVLEVDTLEPLMFLHTFRLSWNCAA